MTATFNKVSYRVSSASFVIPVTVSAGILEFIGGNSENVISALSGPGSDVTSSLKPSPLKKLCECENYH